VREVREVSSVSPIVCLRACVCVSVSPEQVSQMVRRQASHDEERN
jgi:hypothetical protein